MGQDQSGFCCTDDSVPKPTEQTIANLNQSSLYNNRSNNDSSKRKVLKITNDEKNDINKALRQMKNKSTTTSSSNNQCVGISSIIQPQSNETTKQQQTKKVEVQPLPLQKLNTKKLDDCHGHLKPVKHFNEISDILPIEPTDQQGDRDSLELINKVIKEFDNKKHKKKQQKRKKEKGKKEKQDEEQLNQSTIYTRMEKLLKSDAFKILKAQASDTDRQKLLRINYAEYDESISSKSDGAVDLDKKEDLLQIKNKKLVTRKTISHEKMKLQPNQSPMFAREHQSIFRKNTKESPKVTM